MKRKMNKNRQSLKNFNLLNKLVRELLGRSENVSEFVTTKSWQ